MIRADDLRKVSISAADSIDIKDVDRVLGLIEVNLKEAASQGKLLYSANVDMMLPGIETSPAYLLRRKVALKLKALGYSYGEYTKGNSTWFTVSW